MMLLKNAVRSAYPSLTKSATPTSVRWASTDAISELYITNVQDTFAKLKQSGSIIEGSAEAKKQLNDQLNRLASKHGLTNADQIAKLNFQAKKAQLESSVGSLLEGGKSTAQLMTELEVTQKMYAKEHAALMKEEQNKEAMSSGAQVQEDDEWKDDPEFYKYWTQGETVKRS